MNTFPIVRELSSVTVTLVVRFRVLKLALLPAPSATAPPDQFAVLLHSPDPFVIQVPEAVGAAGSGPKFVAAKLTNPAENTAGGRLDDWAVAARVKGVEVLIGLTKKPLGFGVKSAAAMLALVLVE